MRNQVVTVIALLQASTAFGFQPSSTSTTFQRPLAHNLSKHSNIGHANIVNRQPLLHPSKSTASPFLSLQASTSSSTPETVVDTEAIVKYGVAAVTQLSLISGFLYGLDQILAQTGLTVPSAVTWLLCYAFSLKSRVFNPLNNQRPERGGKPSDTEEEGKKQIFQDRIQPSWTPPGVIFPIMWILIISPLRATSSMFVIQSLGEYFTLPFMSLILHLTIGDVWNTINNGERRFGASVVGVSCVYFSALNAAWQYYQVDTLAGKLLGATAIWLTIASALIIQTWRLNVDEEGKMDSLLPMKVDGEESKTQFSWF